MEQLNIKRTHSCYGSMNDLWKYYMNAYLGGNDYIYKSYYKGSNMLYQHAREHKDSYKDRIDRSYYINYCKFVVDTYSKFIFSGKNQIKRITEPEESTEYDIYFDDIDSQNTSIDQFMQKVLANALIYGEVYIYIDKAEKVDEISRAESKENGIKAYAKIIPPTNVLDYSLNDDGSYKWVLIEEEYLMNNNPFEDEECIVEYRLITDEYIYVIDTNGHPKEGYPIDNELKEVPVIKVVLTDIDTNGIGESLLKDIAKVNQEIYNVSSLITEDIENTCFPQMFGPVLDGKEIKGEKSKGVVIGAKNYFEIEEGQEIGYLTPPVDTFVTKREYIQELINEILRIAGLQKDDGVMGSGQASGISKAISFLDTNQSFSEKASKLEQTENQIWDLIKLYDQLTTEITVNYPSEFDVISNAEKVKIANELKLLSEGDSATLNKIMTMNIAEDNFPMDGTEREKIITELEKNSIINSNENIDTNVNNDIKTIYNDEDEKTDGENNDVKNTE